MYVLTRSRATLRRGANAHTAVSLLILVGCCLFSVDSARAQRSLGIDLSAWQGNLTQRVWNRLHVNDNQDFAFIRSSRGGTTGFYNQSDPNNNNGLNTLSQRYDDPYFVQNIARATHAGMLAGPYHFSRPDIVSNTGTDEADHFIEMAGAWMRPGYLLPVHDLEAGDGARSDNAMAQFALDFSDRVHEVMGIRPAIYLNGNYAHNVIGGATTRLKNDVVNTYPVMWNARPESGVNVQTDNPNDYLSWTYGAWDDPPNPSQPWSFWQHSWTGDLSAYNGDLDLNVANGGIEFLKDNLVPALWTGNGGGDWSTLTNWNSGQAPIAPAQGPGQVPRVGGLILPEVRLPGPDDTVILDPDTGSIVTLATGDHQIRKLVTHEELNIVNGSLTINYVPHPESTPYSAKFSAPLSLSGGSLSAHTVQVDSTQTFSYAGGELTINELQLMPHVTTPAKINLMGDVIVNPLDNAAAKIVNGSGGGSPGHIDLGGEVRTVEVSDGASAIDLSIAVPINNGGLAKTGAGTLELSSSTLYDGDTNVTEGLLSITNGVLADVADVYLASSATLNLDFVGTDTIDSLFIDGLSQAAGTWGAVGSAADFTSPLITGTGLLDVTMTPLALQGDFDLDGDVDGADFLKWQTDFGPGNGSDADNDDDTDGDDLAAWQFNYGINGNPPAATQSVPEPSTFALLLLGLAIPHRSRSCRK